MGEFGIGQPVPREEDPYLVRGNGRYVDDVSLVNQARAYVLRSQHSHAKIVSIDVKRARQSPGVLHILTGNDPAVLALGLQSAETAAQAPRRLAAIRHAAAAAGARPGTLHRPAGGDGDRRDARTRRRTPPS